MTAEPETRSDSALVVEIAAGRAPLATLIGAVDAALASETANLTVRVALPEGDPRRTALEALCSADARVAHARPDVQPPAGGVTVAMPATARPGPRTLPQIARLIQAEGLAEATVPVPGRLARRSLGGAKLVATADGAGTRRLRASEVGLRSTVSRGAPGPPPQGDLASERAEHLRHRARSATMRARMDRNAHRLSRERLQVRHERSRLRLAERRVGKSGAGEWVAWRSREVGRRFAALPGKASSIARTIRVTGRRARRFAMDRWRSRGPGPADG